jgi:hypothetical protein
MPRGLAFVLALFATLILVGCGTDTPPQTAVVIVVTATPGVQNASTAIPPTPVLTNTTVLASAPPDAGATEQAFVAATQTQVADAVAVPATATEEVPPTVVLPSFGGTMDLNDWRISLAKMETRSRLVYDATGHAYRPSGQYILLWVDARNLANESRTLQDTLIWLLTDDHKADYREMWSNTDGTTQENVAQAISQEGRDPLYANVTPRGVTHTLLIFDVAADARPLWFWVASQAEDPPIAHAFDLRQQ